MLDDAIKAEPNMAELYFTRAFGRAQKGDIDGAMADYTRTIQLSPDNWGLAALGERGRIYISKGDYANAIADFDQIMKTAPCPISTRRLPPTPSG